MASKILVVDDEPFVVKIMQNRLEANGFLLDTASNGKEALEKAKSFKPDLIVLDYLMPDMTGEETCRMLKAQDDTKDIPVVIFTAVEVRELEAKCMAAGAEAIIYKPTVSDLLEQLKRILDARSTQE